MTTIETVPIKSIVPSKLEVLTFQIGDSKDYIKYHQKLLFERERSIFEYCGDLLKELVDSFYQKYPFLNNIYICPEIEGYDNPFLSENIDVFQERFDYNNRNRINLKVDFHFNDSVPKVCLGCRELHEESDDPDEDFECEQSHISVLDIYDSGSSEDITKYQTLIDEGRSFAKLVVKSRLLEGLLMTIVRQIDRDIWHGYFSPEIYLRKDEIIVENVPYHTIPLTYPRLNSISNWWEIPRELGDTW